MQFCVAGRLLMSKFDFDLLFLPIGSLRDKIKICQNILILNMSSVTLVDAAALRAISNVDVDVCVKTPTACVILVQALST